MLWLDVALQPVSRSTSPSKCVDHCSLPTNNGCSVGGTSSSSPVLNIGCGQDCVLIVDAMFDWVGEFTGVPMTAVLVDTVRSGFELKAPPRERLITGADIAAASTRHGFIVNAGEGSVVNREGRNHMIDGGSVVVSFWAPEISGPTATMSLWLIEQRRVPDTPGVDPARIGQDWVSFRITRVNFRREGQQWTATSAELVAVM